MNRRHLIYALGQEEQQSVRRELFGEFDEAAREEEEEEEKRQEQLMRGVCVKYILYTTCHCFAFTPELGRNETLMVGVHTIVCFSEACGVYNFHINYMTLV